jgi:hypothetical protein
MAHNYGRSEHRCANSCSEPGILWDATYGGSLTWTRQGFRRFGNTTDHFVSSPAWPSLLLVLDAAQASALPSHRLRHAGTAQWGRHAPPPGARLAKFPIVRGSAINGHG